MKTILLVEDDVGIVELMQEVLIDEGYRLVTAFSCREAMSKLETLQPDLIICDLILGDGSSTEVRRYSQTHARLQQVPVLLMSAIRPAEVPNDIWYTDYLAKPFDLADLIARVERLTGLA